MRKKTKTKVKEKTPALYAVLAVEASGELCVSQSIHARESINEAAATHSNTVDEDELQDGDVVYKLVPVAVIRRPTGFTIEKV